ncbi:hypothetical protein RM844_17755 [Streptomyces sp. DSM 44915]|uniref:Uncharacterized protein n=1 Tax=Streptomyces chisholmiae TaxID=3075540 RepID=A0ABU2JT35_9ACTN|nr:hypothetical protein [Streptomyces sp. DSM 44915]MDT0268130.1 hypothetical protein [Streptomyces sp. DSM 44915]
MVGWWDAVPDDERARWALDPLARVGPLGFGMRPAEVSRALAAVTTEAQRPRFSGGSGTGAGGVVTEGDYRGFGLRLYYRAERLAGVAVDALRGPQVLAGDVPLVGRVPSEVERWLADRTAAHEPEGELSYLAAGVPVAESLGVVVDVQRAGDRLLTRPVFVPPAAWDDLPHFLPRQAWSAC